MAMQKLVNYKKIRSLLSARVVSFQSSFEVESKKGFFKQNRRRFSRKAKSLISFAIIIIMLISVFAFLPKGNQSTPRSKFSPTVSMTIQGNISQPSPTSQPSKSNPLSALSKAIGDAVGSTVQALSPSPTPHPPGVIASAQTINSTVWQAVAETAWKYFQPGTGVDSDNGLPYSGIGAPAFTDWDLGVYIQAVIDAQKIGLIGTDGDWGFNARIDKVLTFLETRELNSSTNYPYWFYQTDDGKDYHEESDFATGPVDVVDTGRLFVALANLRAFNSSLAPRINNIVLYGQNNGRSNYTALLPSIQSSASDNSIYTYYVVSGFASFFTSVSNVPSTILNNIVSAQNVTTPEGVSLPKAQISGDPLLCSVFELNNNDSRLLALARQVYLAHEAYYNTTGKYRAFSEGPSLNYAWVYEWVVLSDGRTWTVLDESNSNFDISPMIYTKVAVSFLALYNTTFAHNMSVYLENTLPDPVYGYCEGVDESGHILPGFGGNTNSLILDAALYVIQNNP